jgi:hypothetical protein
MDARPDIRHLVKGSDAAARERLDAFTNAYGGKLEDSTVDVDETWTERPAEQARLGEPKERGLRTAYEVLFWSAGLTTNVPL